MSLFPPSLGGGSGFVSRCVNMQCDCTYGNTYDACPYCMPCTPVQTPVPNTCLYEP